MSHSIARRRPADDPRGRSEPARLCVSRGHSHAERIDGIVTALDVIEHVSDASRSCRESRSHPAPVDCFRRDTNRFSLAAEPARRCVGCRWFPRQFQARYVERRVGDPYRSVTLLSARELRRLFRDSAISVEIEPAEVPPGDVERCSRRRALLVACTTGRVHAGAQRLPAARRAILPRDGPQGLRRRGAGEEHARVKTVILAGGLGTRLAEETDSDAEADGRDRRLADPLAHHEDLRALTGSTSSSSRSATGPRSSRTSSSTTTTSATTSRSTSAQGKVDVHDGDHERLARPPASTPGSRPRPAGASSGSSSTCGDETFMLTYGDGVADVDIAALARLPPRARQARHGDGGAAAGAVRRARRSTATRGRVHREAADRRRLDQRRLLRPRARRARLHRGRRDDLGARAARAARRGRAARRVPSRRLLAADGHAARRSPAREPVAERRRPRGRCGSERGDVGGSPRARHRCNGHGRLVARQGAARARAPTSSRSSSTSTRSRSSSAAATSSAARSSTGALEDLGALERAVTLHEVDTVFHLGAQTIVGVAHRAPLAHLGGQRPRHLQRARGLPPPRRPRAARRRRLERQGVRRDRRLPVHRGLAARRRAIRTRSRRPWPT